MHILVTNDDGVLAPGLLALAQEMRPFGQVTVLAPDRNWSASGHVKTMERPLRVREVTLVSAAAAVPKVRALMATEFMMVGANVAAPTWRCLRRWQRLGP